MHLDDPIHRRRLYFAAALCCFLAAFAMLAVRSATAQRTLGFPNENGLGYYMYLPSLAIDGDLDFHNQAQIALGESPEWVVSGRYPMGVALSVAPTFAAAHALSLSLHGLTGSAWFEPNGFTRLYQIFNLAGILAIWTLAMCLLDRLMVGRFGFDGLTAAAAVLLFWIGSFAFWYVVREPFWAHVLSAAWIAIALYVFDRVLADAERGVVTWRLPLLGFAMALAVLCRLTDVFMAPFALYLAFVFWRRGLVVAALRQTPGVAVALTPLVLQWLVWGAAMGAAADDPSAIGYAEKEVFYWADPVLLLPLFSSLQGLFFYSPILLWSVWGLGWGVAKRGAARDPLLVCLLVSGGLLWYVNGCWFSWWFGGHHFGARQFLDVGALFVIGFGFAVEHLRAVRMSLRVPIAGFVTASLLVGYGLMAARAADRMPANIKTFLFEWERERFAHTLRRARDSERTGEAASRTESAAARPATATPAPSE